MIRIEEYTIEEKEKILMLESKFRKDLTPRQLKDQTLFYRFLQARKFDLVTTEAMLQKHISDIKTYRFGYETYEPPQLLKEYASNSFIGYDNEGFPVNYLDLGKLDLKGIIKCFSFDDLIRYVMYVMERNIDKMTEQSRLLGKSITKLVVIVNVSQLNIFRFTSKQILENIIEGIKFFQDNYPERIKGIYVINAAYCFNLVYTTLKTVICHEILEKITILGISDWKEFLLKEMDPEELPAFLGGNKTDPDGNIFCNSFIVHGKLVPEKYFLNNWKNSDCEVVEMMDEVIVNKQSFTEIPLEVEEPDTIIEWKFGTEAKDIAFGLYYKSNSTEKNKKLEELLPKERINTTSSFKTGSFKCLKPGTYTVVFDNSYSWILPKKVFYRIKVVKPEN